MKTAKVLTATLIASGTLLGASQAMATNVFDDEFGDIYVRADSTRTSAMGGGGSDNSFSGAIAWKFSDLFGVEFNTPLESQRYDTSDVNVTYRDYNLLGQYYPLGGQASQVQPYVGAGVSFTKFNRRGQLQENGVNTKIDSNSWDPVVQAGVDYYLTSWLAANANVQYTDLKVRGSNDYSSNFDPLRVGAGLTFRF